VYENVPKNKLLERGAQMEITDVRVKKVNSGNRMKAIASITFDNEFVIHEIKVIEGQDGLFMAMPRREKNGKFNDIAHPINQATRDKIQNAILEAYEKAEDPIPASEISNEDAE
jgi:stage V sporulation protein G